MHISCGYAKKLIHECDFCKGSIVMSEPIFRGVWYLWKRQHRRYWHFNCYIDQAKLYLELNPFVPSEHVNGGRPRMDISPGDRRNRKNLLVQASKVRTQMKEVVEYKFPGWELNLESLQFRLRILAERIEPIGGVPKKWFT